MKELKCNPVSDYSCISLIRIPECNVNIKATQCCNLWVPQVNTSEEMSWCLRIIQKHNYGHACKQVTIQTKMPQLLLSVCLGALYSSAVNSLIFKSSAINECNVDYWLMRCCYGVLNCVVSFIAILTIGWLNFAYLKYTALWPNYSSCYFLY